MRVPPLLLALLLGLGLACDRAVDPYDPDERVEAPDLSRIFPAGAERAAANDSAGAMPGAPPPDAAGPRGAAPMGGSGRGQGGASRTDGEPIRGTLRLAEGLGAPVPKGAVLFLIARTGASGPPTAVVRVEDPEFPLDFEIGPDDRMLDGIPFTGPFELTARVDADRNAMTRTPGDLQGRSPSPVATGTTGLTLLIDEVL